MIKKCSVIGLGKLGACMAAAIASKGFRVIGVDKDTNCVEAVNRRHAPIFEPGIGEVIRKNGSRILATTDYREAVLNSDVTFIVVPTPSKDNGTFSLKYVNQAARDIGRALAEKSAYHIVVVTSTVLPKDTDSYIKPLLERYSGKVCGRDFGLCYNPEFIALGTVIQNFLNPDFILIGESDAKSGAILARFYKKVCNNNPPIARMNFINAELTKISVNSFITTKITFANMLSELAARLPGGDVDIVTQALGLDSRIGKRYLKGGLGYGGPCFPRDNGALAAVAKKLELKADIPEGTDRFNRRIVQKLYGLAGSQAESDKVIGIIGLSYKPLSSVLEKSQGFLLASKFIKTKRKVVLYDPLCMGGLKKIFSNKAAYAKNLKDAVRLSDILVVANPDNKFLSLTARDFYKLKRPFVLIDCWRLFRNYNFSRMPGFKYIPFGIGGC